VLKDGGMSGYGCPDSHRPLAKTKAGVSMTERQFEATPATAKAAGRERLRTQMVAASKGFIAIGIRLFWG